MYDDRIDCTNSIKFGIHRTCLWRGRMFAEYPNDRRNGRATECLAALAADPAELTDDEWSRLEPHYEHKSEFWREAISSVARQVEFRIRIKDMPGFVKALVGVLQAVPA